MFLVVGQERVSQWTLFPSLSNLQGIVSYIFDIRELIFLHWPHRKAVSAPAVVHATARTVQIQITRVRVRIGR